MTPDRILVDTWDPSYASPYEPEEDLAAPDVDLDIEVAEAAWQPLGAPSGTPAASEILFVDGVQRVDARVTLVDGDLAVAGMAGSFAAGTVRHRTGTARLERMELSRGLFTRATDVSLDCGGGVRYRAYAAADTAGDTLTRVMTEQMRALEKVLAADAEAELVVIDGPLSGGRHVSGAVGLVKSHRRVYLPEPMQALVGRLEPGQRTPLFLTVTNYSRYSWYLRLPGPASHPWAGVARCEASGDLTLGEVRRLAACTQATLPSFASTPHRDARAPQNLLPIGELERQLRHRLGDPGLVERMLRRTCAVWRP